jgi:hypothetical protein
VKVVRVETGSGHRYETDTGQPVPGVTTIIGDAVNKPALVPWAAKASAGYAVDNWDLLTELPPSKRLERITKEWRGVRDRAAVQGTRVHAFAEAVIRGDTVEVPEPLLPYVSPYAQWLDDWQVRPVMVEAVVWSDEPCYAGTLDLIADLSDGGTWLLDIKTSGGVWPETGLQLAAYRWAEHVHVVGGADQPMPDVDRSGVIWLPGDGRCELIPVNTGPPIYEAFEAAAVIAKWSHMKKADLIGRALIPPVRSSA